MEAIPRNDGEQYRFDAFCKAVMRNEARTITEIRNVCLTVKSHSAFFRWKNWGSSRV